MADKSKVLVKDLFTGKEMPAFGEERLGNKQVKAHLKEEEAEDLTTIRVAFGFKSDYQFVKASVRIMLKCLKKVLKRKVIEEQMLETSEEEIEAMFLEMTEVEQPQLGRGYENNDNMSAMFGAFSFLPQPNSFTEDYQANKALNKTYVDKFVRQHYERLFRQFAKRKQKPLKSNGYTPLDIFEDTIARLYETDKVFEDYEEFEAYALGKFKE